jgi:hypothetical protein
MAPVASAQCIAVESLLKGLNGLFDKSEKTGNKP